MAHKVGLRSAGQTLLFIIGAAVLFGLPFALELAGHLDEAMLPIALAGIAFAAAILAVLRSGHAAERAKRSAAEAEALSHRLLPVLDTLSQRLLRLESRLTYQPAGEGAPRLEATVAEVSTEISVLGQLVRDLAVALAAQDRDVAVLKDQVTRVSGPGLAPRAVAAAPRSAAPAPTPQKLVTPTLFPM